MRRSLLSLLPMRRLARVQRRADFVVGVAFALSAFVVTAPHAVAAGDPKAGQAVFSTRCGACHTTQAGQNKVGPSLSGIAGSKAGTVPGYNFSPAMKNANVTWDDAALDKFLANPAGFVHGTKMFVSLPGATDRQNVIAYLNTLLNTLKK